MFIHKPFKSWFFQQNGGLSTLKRQYREKWCLSHNRSFGRNRSFAPEKLRNPRCKEIGFGRGGGHFYSGCWKRSHGLNRSHGLESFSWTGIVLMDWNRSHGLESFSWNGIVLMDWTFSWDLEMLPVFPDIGPLDFWISLSFCICRQFGGSSSCFPVALCHGRCGCCAVCARDSMWWNWDIERGNRFDKTWSVAPALEGLRGLQPFL